MEIRYYSKTINVNVGQKSLISPLLFNIDIDDLLKELIMNICVSFEYADDTLTINKDKDDLDTAISIVENGVITIK